MLMRLVTTPKKPSAIPIAASVETRVRCDVRIRLGEGNDGTSGQRTHDDFLLRKKPQFLWDAVSNCINCETSSFHILKTSSRRKELEKGRTILYAVKPFNASHLYLLTSNQIKFLYTVQGSEACLRLREVIGPIRSCSTATSRSIQYWPR
jgi:hypothetical protein